MQILLLSLSDCVDEIIKKLPSQCKNLKVIGYDEALPSSDILPQLIGLNFIIHPYLVVPTDLPTLPNVTTLYLPDVIHITGLENVYFPRLRHLSIEGHASHPDPRPLLEWLRANGSRLITLFWTGETSDGDFLAELWDLCPHVRHLRLPRGTKWTPPPPGRSLDLLRVDIVPPREFSLLPCSRCHHIHGSGVIQFGDCVPQLGLASVSCVTIVEEWSYFLDREDWDDETRLESMHCMKLHTASYGISMVDVLGSTFEDAIVSRLEERLSGLYKPFPVSFYF